MFLTCIELTLQTMLLCLEAQSVVGLRVKKIGDGGPAAAVEAHRMVTEKTAAFSEVVATFIRGGSVRSVICRLRTHVKTNEVRLRGSGT
jgi:hypothetical protein